LTREEIEIEKKIKNGKNDFCDKGEVFTSPKDF